MTRNADQGSLAKDLVAPIRATSSNTTAASPNSNRHHRYCRELTNGNVIEEERAAPEQRQADQHQPVGPGHYFANAGR